jgi:hypothetical protein
MTTNLPTAGEDIAKVRIEGHVLITDPETNEILVDKKNAIHFENFSEALALSLANRPNGFIQEMSFGNGASTVSGTGAITYFPPNVTGSEATLYNQTYSKVVNDQSPLNTNKATSFIRIVHGANSVYSDIIVTCLLDYNEPAGQEAFDDTTSTETQFVFDELGLFSYDDSGAGKLLTHVIFHPVQKSLNRTIQVRYTLRIYMV